MKIIADENVFEPIIEFLQEEGHEVINVRKSNLSGSSDDTIYKLAVDKKMIIVTMDKDFSRMLRFPPEKCGGIIVVKLYKMTVDKATKICKQYFRTIDLTKIAHKLVIITPEGVKLRSRKI